MKKTIITLIMTGMFLLILAACGGQDQESQQESQAEPTGPVTAVELEYDQYDALMWQVAQKEIPLRCQEYIPDEGFANAQVFGVDRQGNVGTAYVNLFEGEYAVVHDKAYLITGSAGEAILKFNYTEDVPELTEVIWSADGGQHDDWVQENFPKKYYKKLIEYDPYDENGRNILEKSLQKKVENEMSVPVETENQLLIDENNGYQIIKVFESGSMVNGDYKFETEVLEEGNLEDLKE